MRIRRAIARLYSGLAITRANLGVLELVQLAQPLALSDVRVQPTHKDQANRGDLLRGLAGLSLIGTFWPIAWRQVRPISNYYFFPLWLGYVLTVDSAVALRTGTSPMHRSGLRSVWMFAASVPLWWLFEAANKIVHNWKYHFAEPRSRLEFVVLASIDFSTVIPAVLTTTELIRSFRLDPLRRLPAITETPSRLLVTHAIGWVAVAVTAKWPKQAFPLVWTSLIFIADPIATKFGCRSIAWHVRQGDWSAVSNLALGTLTCGFFWEMWNHRSLPKWTYDLPYVEFLHIFEMPVLGYSGYLPFGSEVYAFYTLLQGLLEASGLNNWIALPEVPVSSSLPGPVHPE